MRKLCRALLFSGSTGVFVTVLGGLLVFGSASARDGNQRVGLEAQGMGDLGYGCIEIKSGVYYCCADRGRICWVQDTRTQAAMPQKNYASMAYK